MKKQFIILFICLIPILGLAQIQRENYVETENTFYSFPFTPSSEPTEDYQVVNLKYVNDNYAILYDSIDSLRVDIGSATGTSLPDGTSQGQILWWSSGAGSWLVGDGSSFNSSSTNVGMTYEDVDKAGYVKLTSQLSGFNVNTITVGLNQSLTPEKSSFIVAKKNMPSSTVLFQVDTSGNGYYYGYMEAASMIFTPQASAPTATESRVYYNSSDKHFYGYNGTTWVQLDN